MTGAPIAIRSEGMTGDALTTALSALRWRLRGIGEWEADAKDTAEPWRLPAVAGVCLLSFLTPDWAAWGR